MKHTLFPYFFSLLYAWRGEKQIVSSSSLFYHLPILFLYTFFHSKPSSLVSYMEMRIQCQVNLIIMFILLSSKGKKWMNSYFLFLKITLESKMTQCFIRLLQKTYATIHLIMGTRTYTPFSIKHHLSVALCSSLSQLSSHWEQRFWCVWKGGQTGLLDVNFAASSSLLAAKTVPGVQRRSRGYSLADVFPG